MTWRVLELVGLGVGASAGAVALVCCCAVAVRACRRRRHRRREQGSHRHEQGSHRRELGRSPDLAPAGLAAVELGHRGRDAERCVARRSHSAPPDLRSHAHTEVGQASGLAASSPYLELLLQGGQEEWVHRRENADEIV